MGFSGLLLLLRLMIYIYQVIYIYFYLYIHLPGLQTAEGMGLFPEHII